MGEAGRSCRACTAAKKKCLCGDGAELVRGRPAKQGLAKGKQETAELRPKRKRPMKEVADSSDEVEEVAEPSGKRAMQAVPQVVVGQRVKVAAVEPEDDPADDELGMAVREAGQDLKFGWSLVRIGTVVGKYELRKD
jgi:hypothetical protein